MKAKELMIGDWVMYNPNVFIDDEYEPTKESYPIQIISGEDIDLAIEGCYQPIPLTPEILKKNGYKQTKGGKLMGLHVADIFDLEISDKYGRLLKIDLQDFGSTEATHWYIAIQGIFSISGYIGYIHQLQYIYRLCGVEKDIEL